MKSRFLALGFACALAFTFTSAAHAQTVPLSGKVVSASTTIFTPGETDTVFTTPATGHFVLTQVCAIGAGMAFQGNTFGPIAEIGGASTPPLCYSFSPGYAMPKNEAIGCKNLGANTAGCSISGILTQSQ